MYTKNCAIKDKMKKKIIAQHKIKYYLAVKIIKKVTGIDHFIKSKHMTNIIRKL